MTHEYHLTGELKRTYGSRVYPIGYGYDAQGRLKLMTNWTIFIATGGSSGERVTTWNYDAYRGWLQSKRYPDNTGPDYANTLAGRLLTRAWARTNSSGSRITVTNSYNNAGDLSGLTYNDGVTPTVSYGYDRRGRREMITRNGITTTLSYTDLDQLLSESHSGGALNTLSVVNTFGSYRGRTATASKRSTTVLGSTSYGYDTASRLSTVTQGNESATYSYVANSSLVGQVAFKQNTTVRMTTSKWDAESRLMKLESLSGAPAGSKRRLEFDYDYLGRRIWKKVTNLDTSTVMLERKYVYDGWNLIAELDGNNNLVQAYAWGLDLSGSMQGAGGVGGLLIAAPNGSNTQFAAYDGNGNVAGYADATTGAWVARYEYGPFGEPIRVSGAQAEANPFRWSTKYTDDESGLVYYDYRYYNASTGRWISRDPIGERGGVNLYGFVSNDGMNKMDALGLLIMWLNPLVLSTNMEPIPTPNGEMYGATAWNRFDHKAWAFKSPVDCCWKVASQGRSQVWVWWDKYGIARDHEIRHINEHYFPAHHDFKSDADQYLNTCMSKSKAECIAKMIGDEMKEAYKTRAWRDASEFDCTAYGNPSDPKDKTCGKAAYWRQEFSRLWQAYQNAITRCQGIPPHQQNLWVDSGSGRRPRL